MNPKPTPTIPSACLACLLFAAAAPAADTTMTALIPQPQKLEHLNGQFTLRPETRIIADADALETARYLSGRLARATGYPLPVGTSSAPASLRLATHGAAANLGAEGYDLTVMPDSVVIRAAQPAGMFYGVQTLLQLLPP
jgi:hexosaminidase